MIGDKMFDLTKPYMLILARGSATENGVSYHGRQKVISSRQINLAETRSVGASKGSFLGYVLYSKKTLETAIFRL